MAVCCKCKGVVKLRSINALGKTYHPHHFTCSDCDRPIESSTFNVVKNEPVCTACYDKKHASRCFACGTSILQRGVVAVGRKWHEKCFRCVSCGKSLVSSTFFEVNGYLFCKSDYRESFSSRCAGCAEPIAKNAVVALNTKWHANCFKCNRCSQPITGESFKIEGSRPVCAKCTK
ncbi:transforming growth factor beta-1-induced transcript 1 protein [Scaptodrosophila lebanonensis]|uniref:Transforming growth factor beta-1-induced transcript 1 protein n=1 Tax=Drosophila lebanonensis TaxID=7225 RepID=A0A6J2TUA7_DROLE|nr:transforming growth factor beta-1-induced transcript 1 protein [Scaptodrosophila lebanonensis]